MPFTATLPSQADIDDVIADLKLMQSGADVYFAIDSFELIDYCFPVDVDSPRPRSSRLIAEEQAALWEVFEKRLLPPILIPEYESEIQKHLTYVRTMGDDVRRTVSMINAVLGDEAGKPPMSTEDSNEELLRSLETKFNILLAGIMGMLSIGVDRFRKVLTNRIVRPRDVPIPPLQEAAAAYRASDLVGDIFEAMTRNLEQTRFSKDEMERRRRNARTDARAVDWVLYINQAMETAFNAGKLGRRIVILYLSSAPRTDRIFQLRLVREALPIVNGQRHNPRRKRAHVLEYLISRELDADNPENYSKTIENLEKQKKVLQGIGALGLSAADPAHECDSCVLENGEGLDCPLLELCRRERRRIEKIENLGLVAEIQEYERLVNAKPHDKNHKELLAIFRELLTRPNLPDLALAHMKATQSAVIAEASFAEKSEAARKTPKPKHEFLRPRSRYLPIKPVVPTPVYAELVDQIFEVPIRAPEEGSEDFAAEYARLVDPIYAAFLDLDRAKPNSGEHELVRCLTYMTFPKGEGDVVALEYARKKRTAYPEYEADFTYIIIWAASRIGRYKDSYDAANEAVTRWPLDGRFYHGRSVNTIRWLTDERYSRFCSRDYADAIEDAQRAIDLLRGREPFDPNVVGNNLNNIAYLRSKQTNSKEYDLTLARNAMDQLRELISQQNWMPNHPEYVHTEANLVLHEVRHRVARHGARSEDLDAIHAAIDSLRAVAGYISKEVYQKTISEFEALRKELSAKVGAARV